MAYAHTGVCPAIDPGAADLFAAARRRMVEEQLEARDIADQRVLAAMRTVPRHLFVPESLREEAYDDKALSLGPEQSISQPYIVAKMTELAAPAPGERILEVGTGSGYQAAVLAEISEEVYTIEADSLLAERAATTLEKLHYRNVHTRHGDGRNGWPEAAPFGAIIVTACAREVPTALEHQLDTGGRLVLPLGTAGTTQTLRVFERRRSGRLVARDIMPVRFVPLT